MGREAKKPTSTASRSRQVVRPFFPTWIAGTIVHGQPLEMRHLVDVVLEYSAFIAACADAITSVEHLSGGEASAATIARAMWDRSKDIQSLLAQLGRADHNVEVAS